MTEHSECKTVRQVRLRAKPAPTHPTLKPWQTAKIAILVRDEDGDRAVSRAMAAVARRHWQVLERTPSATVEEGRVRGLSDDAWETYLRAVAGELVFLEFPEQIHRTPPGSQMFAPPVLTEARFDQVINGAGGRRITDIVPNQDDQNADYLLGCTIFELKTLDDDGLTKAPRQAKLARLFASYAEGPNCLLDPKRLTPEELLVYLEIMGSPIKAHVKKAARQVKSSRKALGNDSLKGGIIVLNTGFPALGQPHFANQVAEYAKKGTSNIASVIAISVWMESNGFDSVVHTAFEPYEGGGADVATLRASYWHWFELMMTDLMTGKAPQEEWTMNPCQPGAFTIDGITYRWEPERPPDTFGEP